MEITFEQLTHQNFSAARALDRDDIPESFVDTAATIMEITDYGYENNLIGHTYLILCDGRYAGLILLGEAIPWDTDPPEVHQQPFYRLMGFVISREFRGKGVGGEALEKTIAWAATRIIPGLPPSMNGTDFTGPIIWKAMTAITSVFPVRNMFLFLREEKLPAETFDRC